MMFSAIYTDVCTETTDATETKQNKTKQKKKKTMKTLSFSLMMKRLTPIHAQYC